MYKRQTKLDLRPYARESADGGLAFVLPDSVLDGIVELATSDPERRFREEGVVALAKVRVLGTVPLQEKALSTLKALASSKDATISALATWNLENPLSKEVLTQAIGPIPK